MNRRDLMAGLGVAGVMVPLLASVEAQAATSSSLTAYRKGTLTISTISRRASEIALKKASDPKVKQFAELELAEQITVEQVLTNKKNPSFVTLAAADEDALKHLATLSGSQFDQAYVGAEIGGHEKLLGIQEALIAKQGLGSDTSHIAYFLRTFIHEHLTLLAALKKG